MPVPTMFQAAVISDFEATPYHPRTGAHSTFVAELIPFLGQTMAYDALPYLSAVISCHRARLRSA